VYYLVRCDIVIESAAPCMG